MHTLLRRLLGQKSADAGETSAAPAAPKRFQEPELQWHFSGDPRADAAIAFEWCGTVFEGFFRDYSRPWGVAWYVDTYYFSRFLTYRAIDRNQITRWAYTDGS
jgi:hypothetical protein